MTHPEECDSFCSKNITAEILNAHGFPTEIANVESSMGMVFRNVLVEGEPFRTSKYRAFMTAGSPFRLCTRGMGRPQTRVPFTPDPETVAWFMSIRRESSRAS